MPRIGRLVCVLAALLVAWPVWALTFPPLTGRVVDEAGVLSADAKALLDGKLKTLEDKSGIQLVAATVGSLEGQEIEPYANQLFRAWGIGQKQKNNGVLLLVAPKEHRVRIEVGYGEEGVLTDAISSVIIVNAMAPRFKAGDYDGGVARGVDDIIAVLTTDTSDWQQRPDLRVEAQTGALDGLMPFLLLGAILLVVISILRSSYRNAFLNIATGVLLSSPGRGGGSYGGGGDFGGGFSGGGGSSGGGGASGGW